MITPKQLIVLWLLSLSPRRPSELSEYVEGNQSNISQILGRLEDKKLITRKNVVKKNEGESSDMRFKIIEITASGSKIVEKANPEISISDLCRRVDIQNKLIVAIKNLEK